MNKTHTPGLLLLALAQSGWCMLCAEPPSGDYEAVFSDEFNEPALDTEVWHVRSRERVKFHSVDLPDNVQLKDGRLSIAFRKAQVDGEEQYSGGGIHTNGFFGYGYYEAKGRLWGGGPGLHSSFWSMGLNGGDGVSVPKYNKIIEIDGYEVNSHAPSQISLNAHYNIGRQFSIGGMQGTAYSFDVDTSEQDFVLGYEWLPDQINWYLNGKLIRHLDNPQVYGPQNVWLTALASPKGFGGGPPVIDRTLPGQSSWDYFRYYVKPLPGVNLLGNGSFDYNIGKDFDHKHSYDPHYPVAWLQDGDIDASQVVLTREAFEGDCIFRYAGEKPYQVTTSQDLAFIPNGAYTLTARVRSSGGQALAQVTVSGSGTEPRSVGVSRTDGKKWETIAIDDVIVSNNHCTVTIATKADPGQWLEIDAISLAMKGEATEGKPDYIPAAGQREERYLGEIVVDDSDGGKAYVEKGKWGKSSLSGYKGISRYTGDAGAVATWTADIPKAGSYRIWFNNIAYGNNAPEALLEVRVGDQLVTRRIQHQGMEREWVDLGTYALSAGEASSVTLRRVEGSGGDGYLRADTVRFIPTEPSNMSEAVVMKVEHNYAIVDMSETKIDPVDPSLTPFRGDDGRVYVPLDETLDLLAAFTGANEVCVSDSEGFWEWLVGVFDDDPALVSLDIDGESRELEFPLKEVAGYSYLAASDAARCFGLQLFEDERSGLIIFSPYPNILGVPPDAKLVREINAQFPEK